MCALPHRSNKFLYLISDTHCRERHHDLSPDFASLHLGYGFQPALRRHRISHLHLSTLHHLAINPAIGVAEGAHERVGDRKIAEAG